ncbi:unnamed protein product [Cyclocybe aegerita]|uniref:FAD-binding domain-containing protein n=1 Tax=Cyclocybe aegerita TaxID=1973307 RepID=A0A8S0WT51_CYCAE|nr:unnamed protein product [Cyclocybe aegerita]
MANSEKSFGASTNRRSGLSLEPLELFSSGCIILAGDAAHAMTPHQGSGAGQAVEDACVLAVLLCYKLCNKSNLSLIGKVYDQIRRPVANQVLAASCISGKLCGLVAPGFEDVEEGNAHVSFEKLTKLIDDFGKGMEWVWKESAEDDKRRAIEMLESLGTG